MSSTALRELEVLLRDRVELDVPLAPLTTYRIGGPAAAVVHPRSVEDVARVLRFAGETETRWLALGLGSNMLIADRGFDGVVIRLGKGMDALTRDVDGDRHAWRAGAGLPTPLLARRSARAGLAGVHRLVGVPGTVGGGVFMNAGAHGQDFSRVVRQIELVDAAGEARTVQGAAVAWRYRSSGLEGIVVGATLALAPAPTPELEADIRRHFRWRQAGTPFNEPCCGSVFRNPAQPPHPGAGAAGVADDSAAAPAAGGGEAGGRRTAGQLIEAAGLKGLRIGGARVSPRHANYIVNTGAATAADVLAVIERVRETVLTEFGIALELEVKIIE